MIEAQHARREAPGLDLVGDVARAEHRGRKADEVVQRDKDDVQFVDQQQLAGARAGHEQRQCREQRQERGGDVDARAQPIARHQGQHAGRDQRDQQYQRHPVDRPWKGAHVRSPLNSVQRLHVDGVEALANAEQEDADHDQRHQHREGDADLDDERHPPCAGRGEDQAVLDRHEADDLADRIAPGDHHQEAKQDDREREGEVLARQRAGGLGHPQHQHDRQRDQPHAGQHRRADADHRLDVAVDPQALDHPVKRDRDDDRPSARPRSPR